MRRAALGCLVAKVAAFPWQGTFPELRIDANDTVAAVTETLYALADETEPLTAALLRPQFVIIAYVVSAFSERIDAPPAKAAAADKKAR